MDTVKCRAFVAAANLGSFSAAAEHLGYTTPGLSHLVGTLEEELGFSLFFRSRQGVQLTGEGQRFLPLVEEFLANEDRLYAFSDEIKGILTGKVSLSAYPSIISYMLPPLIQAFREKYPQVTVTIEENFRSGTFAGLRKGNYDLAFLTGEVPAPLTHIPLRQDELVVALPKNHPLAKRKAIPLSVLKEEPFIMPGREGEDNDAGLFLAHNNIKPHIVYAALSNAATLGLVKQGLGISLLYRLSTTHWEKEVALLPLSPRETIHLGIALTGRKYLSPAAARFLSMALDVLGQPDKK